MTTPTHEHWYDAPQDTNLRQGDIFRGLVVLSWPQDLPAIDEIPPDGGLLVKPVWHAGDWIVMSASCDVDRNASSYPYAMLGRVVPATKPEFGVTSDKEFDHMVEVVRKGLDPSKFLLAEHPDAAPPFPLSVVFYRQHALMPTDYLRRSCAGRRLRLKHPLRETFGAWVGANISRVGPENELLIPSTGVRTWPIDILRASERGP